MQKIKSKGKVFRDPVHRLIRIEPEDQFVLDLINSREFQRLRRVRQLGVSSFTYHGAEHSRFVHSLGVFNFAQRIIDALRVRYSTASDIRDLLGEHRKVALAAALLHDIGHGPFSHMIERAKGSSFDHEKMTSKLIKSETGDISAVLNSHDIDPKAVAAVIEKRGPHPLIVDIVSSQLDADRMDYLLRDSLMTGVEYGIYDSEWLLNAMCVGLDPHTPTTADMPNWRLCLDRGRGLFAAEQLILSRHHMMLQVYMHRVTRGYEVMLLNLFQLAAKAQSDSSLATQLPSGIDAYFESGIDMDLDSWLTFDEAAMVAAFQVWAGSTRAVESGLKRFSVAYLNRERLFVGHQGRPSSQVLMDLVGELEGAGLKNGLHWGVDNGEHLPYKGVYHLASKGGGSEEVSALSILLSDGQTDSSASAIESDESSILRGLDSERQQIWRLYIDRDKLDDAKPVLEKLGIERQGGSG